MLATLVIQFRAQIVMCVIQYTKFIEQSFFNKQVNKIIHYVLAKSMTSSWLHLVFDQLFDHIVCDSHFSQLVLGPFGNKILNKSRHYVLAIRLVLLRDGCLTKQ